MNKIYKKRPIIIASNSIELNDAFDLMITDKLASDFPFFNEGHVPIYGGNCYNANLHLTPYNGLFHNPNPAQALHILLIKLNLCSNLDNYNLAIQFMSLYDKFNNEQLKD